MKYVAEKSKHSLDFSTIIVKRNDLARGKKREKKKNLSLGALTVALATQPITLFASYPISAAKNIAAQSGHPCDFHKCTYLSVNNRSTLTVEFSYKSALIWNKMDCAKYCKHWNDTICAVIKLGWKRRPSPLPCCRFVLLRCVRCPPREAWPLDAAAALLLEFTVLTVLRSGMIKRREQAYWCECRAIKSSWIQVEIKYVLVRYHDKLRWWPRSGNILVFLRGNWNSPVTLRYTSETLHAIVPFFFKNYASPSTPTLAYPNIKSSPRQHISGYAISILNLCLLKWPFCDSCLRLTDGGFLFRPTTALLSRMRGWQPFYSPNCHTRISLSVVILHLNHAACVWRLLQSLRPCANPFLLSSMISVPNKPPPGLSTIDALRRKHCSRVRF